MLPLKKFVPNPVKNALKPWRFRAQNYRYRLNLYRRRTKKNRLLILATMPRSGTNFMMYLLTNYLRLVSGTSDGPLSSRGMASMIPNLWDRSYLHDREYQPPTTLLDCFGLDDIPVIHSRYRWPHWDQTKVLHLYRNPLDFAVSNYFYTYKYRASRADMVSHPVEILDMDHFDIYVVIYRSFREAAKAGKKNLLRISYEDLITNPEACLKIVLRWIGVEPNNVLIETATHYSSRETMSKIEERDGPLDLTIPDFTGKFVRDGSIGQWKQYFDESEYRRIRDKFSRQGINLEEFILE